MPKAMHYNANSVVYFTGDVGEKIFILQSGKIALKSHDIETGEEVTDLIQTGEFFGVKSALGHYPREEDAMVLQDSQCLMFTVPEFEDMVTKNSRITLKMLKVFSNQLRRIHGKVSNLLAMGKREIPEQGLFNIAEYYLNKQMYPEAIYTLRKYQKHYPQGIYRSKAGDYLIKAEKYAQEYGKGKGPAIIPAPAAEPPPNPNQTAPKKPRISTEEEEFYTAVTFLGQQDYQKAAEILGDIIKAGKNHPNYYDANLEMAQALIGLGKADKCIEHLKMFIQNNKTHAKVPEAMVYISEAWLMKGEKEQAGKILEKVLKIPSNDDVSRKKAHASLRRIRGKS